MTENADERIEDEIFEEAFWRLSPTQKRVLNWKRIDLSYEEIGENLGVSPVKAELDLASALYWLTLHVEDAQAGEWPRQLVRMRRHLVAAYLRFPRLVWVWRAGTALAYRLESLDADFHADNCKGHEEIVLIASLGVVLELGWNSGSASYPKNGRRLSRLIRNQARTNDRRSFRNRLAMRVSRAASSCPPSN